MNMAVAGVRYAAIPNALCACATHRTRSARSATIATCSAISELSTHSIRKTVATILDREGLSATEIADYLGHENLSITRDV
jgi:integrase